ncbi:MAG: class E sortase [Actinomycetota bacterium]|nr:class E sortase [Actinomycetota bacterium]
MIFIVACVGLFFMLYPSIENAIVGAKHASVLSEWEDRKEDLPGEEIYNDLTAKDFFPLKMPISKIDLEQISYEGADTQTLNQGPEHIEETPPPDDNGRCTISGHRTAYNLPFRKIDEFGKGDLIYPETMNGELFTYAVMGTDIVNPEDIYIPGGTRKRELLLTACEPEYSAVKRLVIIAELLNLHPLELAAAESN